MAQSMFPPFRSHKVKETKPRSVRNEAGFFAYKCRSCGVEILRRKRQAHPDEQYCGRC